MIIGITGTLGAGKGTVTDFLVEKKNFLHASVSGFLAAEAQQRGIYPDRIARQRIANEFREKGPTGLMEAVYASVKDDIAHSARVVLEPQHTVAEVLFVQSLGGIEISVDADLRTRYDRIYARGSEKDHVTFEEFSRIQEREMWSDDPNKNNLGAAMARADIHLTNNGTPAELFALIEEAVQPWAQKGC